MRGVCLVAPLTFSNTKVAIAGASVFVSRLSRSHNVTYCVVSLSLDTDKVFLSCCYDCRLNLSIYSYHNGLRNEMFHIASIFKILFISLAIFLEPMNLSIYSYARHLKNEMFHIASIFKILSYFCQHFLQL